MNSKGAAAAMPTQEYEDFVPSSKLVQEEHFDTFQLNLPGFKKEQLRVQLTTAGILKISGQRLIGQNRWQRFQKEFPVSENCDKDKINAKIENGILYVKQPKLISSAVKRDKELPATEAENMPAKRQKTTLTGKRSDAEKNSAEKRAKEEPKSTSPKTNEQQEAKDLPENIPAEKTSTGSMIEDGKESSSSSESENESTDDESDDDTIGNASSLAANLKMPREVMKMALVAVLVLGIELYVANVMKSKEE